MESTRNDSRVWKEIHFCIVRAPVGMCPRHGTLDFECLLQCVSQTAQPLSKAMKSQAFYRDLSPKRRRVWPNTFVTSVVIISFQFVSLLCHP